jgi:hypothetical protein
MTDPIHHPLLALVKERNLIDDLQLEEVIQEQARSGKSFGTILSDFQLVDTDTQLQLIAEHLSTEVVDLGDYEATPELLKAVPAASRGCINACRWRAWFGPARRDGRSAHEPSGDR